MFKLANIALASAIATFVLSEAYRLQQLRRNMDRAFYARTMFR